MKDDVPCGNIVLRDGGAPVVLGKALDTRGLVARLDAAGRLDTTFGTDGGGVYLPASTTSSDLEPRALALDGDRIVVLGTDDNAKVEVIRLLASGLPDPSFGGTGTVESPPDYAGAVTGKLAVDAARRIVTLAHLTDLGGPLVMRRIAENGTYDAAFAGGGAITVDAAHGALGIQPDGKIVVAHGTSDGVAVHRWYP
jgi:hypothetical protein